MANLKDLLNEKMPLLVGFALNWKARWIQGTIHFDNIVTYFTPMKFYIRFTETFRSLSLANGRKAINAFVFESIHCSDYAIL